MNIFFDDKPICKRPEKDITSKLVTPYEARLSSFSRIPSPVAYAAQPALFP